MRNITHQLPEYCLAIEKGTASPAVLDLRGHRGKRTGIAAAGDLSGTMLNWSWNAPAQPSLARSG